MKKLFDRSLLLFLAVGVLNTLISAGIMQALYGWLRLGYWASSAIAFAVTSVLSYILNKRFSFKNEGGVAETAWRFALVIAVCYTVAYFIAKPATAAALAWLFPDKTMPVEQIAMLVGQVLFTGMNYFGQRFFAFKAR